MFFLTPSFSHNRQRREKRQYDRRSGNPRTGVKSQEKRGGAGAGNWGKPEEQGDLEEIEKQTPEETENPENIENADPENENVEEKEPGPVKSSLDEYHAGSDIGNKSEKKNIRQASEGKKIKGKTLKKKGVFGNSTENNYRPTPVNPSTGTNTGTSRRDKRPSKQSSRSVSTEISSNFRDILPVLPNDDSGDEGGKTNKNKRKKERQVSQPSGAVKPVTRNCQNQSSSRSKSQKSSHESRQNMDEHLDLVLERIKKKIDGQEQMTLEQFRKHLDEEFEKTATTGAGFYGGPVEQCCRATRELAKSSRFSRG